MSRVLYYTIENILSELTTIIIENSNLPEQILECYEELNHLAEDLDVLMEKTGMDSQELANEITDIYLDMVDLYVGYLEVKASHIYA
jgi:hypothetical protein